MCAGSAIAGTSSSSQSPPDNEFETDGLIRPVPLVACSLGDPAAEGFLFRGRQRAVGGCRRHHPRVGRKYALDDFALIRIAGNNWSAASFRFQRFVAKIEPHIGHAGTDVGSMAAKAGARHDGTDVAVEAHGTR